MQGTVTAHPSGVVVVTLAGQFDLSHQADLMDILEVGLQFSRWLIVDLAEVTFMDSASITALLWGHRRVEQRGGKLVIVAPPSSVVKILEITQLKGVVQVAPDGVTAAERFFQTSEPLAAGD